MSAFTPSAFAHLVNAETDTITILGFGSLVSEASARKSFELSNFRFGTCTGYQRIFNRADWINIDWGDARTLTGEVCSVALAKTDSPITTRVALMEVTADEGLEGFLHREATYTIIQVPYVDDEGNEGIALACGECSDEDMLRMWPKEECWYLQNCSGKISYITPPEGVAMPLVPEAEHIAAAASDGSSSSSSFVEGDPTVFLPMTTKGRRPYTLPLRDFVYPSPGYLRYVYRAHVRAGIHDNFLDTTLLMDRRTSIRMYLQANPLLEAWVVDPKCYKDRICDRYG